MKSAMVLNQDGHANALAKTMILPAWSIVFTAVLIVAVLVAIYMPSKVEPSAEAMMVDHSAQTLNESTGSNKNIAALQDKLQLNKMVIDMDTQTFTAKRDTAKEMIKAMCSLPDSICNSMVASLGMEKTNYHKKRSVPLDDNQGAYFSAWMWVRSVGHDDMVQVAFKVAKMEYKLRDVVTYREQMDEEPVIKCEKYTQLFFFSSATTETCKEVARKKIVTQMPVFKQAIMNPEEMHLVDTIMERMLSERALGSAVSDTLPVSGAGAASAGRLQLQ